MQSKPVQAVWAHEGMVFDGGVIGGPTIHIDGDAKQGPSPVDTFLVALAGCSGADVVDIARKKRIDLKEFRVEVQAERRDEYPRRVVKLKLIYHCVAPGATEAAFRQAIDLSLEKYCSVTHSLNPDIPVTYELRLQA